MDASHGKRRRTFFAIHRNLPREGPGNRASTLRALDLARQGLAAPPAWVVDMACGPGAQTLDLASALPRARILALDLHEPFLRSLAVRAAAARQSPRVAAVRAAMQRMPVAGSSVDLLWCEGAAYIMGVTEALAGWRALLRPGGVCAFTEPVWLAAGAPEPARRCFEDYPKMGSVAECAALVGRSGYELLGEFVLPPEAWWDDYYRPMSARLGEVELSCRGDPVAMEVVDACHREIDSYRRYADWYGYAFFVARRV